MINWARVDELKDEIGNEDFAEVADLFIEEVEEVMARLKAGPNPALLEKDLHFLKSSCLNLGFDDLSRLCAIGETDAAEGRFEDIQLAPIFDMFASSKQAFISPG